MRTIFFILSLLIPLSGFNQKTHINGAGIKMRINSGSGITTNISAPVIYYPAQSGTITFTDDHFQYSIPGYAKTGFTARSAGGFVEFLTSETSITVQVGGDWANQGVESDCDVLVNGVYNQSCRLTANNTTQDKAITLPAGTKLVRLQNGYTANTADINTPADGVFIQGVVTTGDIRIKIPTTPIKKWLFVGNSITTGATATHPLTTGFVGLLRASGLNVQWDSWGARLLSTSTTTLANTMATQLSSQLNGIDSNFIVILLGTNNFGLTGDGKVTFKDWYGKLVDALHTLRPDVIMYCVSPIIRTTYSTPNGSGATLDDFADAINELAATRSPWMNYVYGKNLVSIGNLPDGVHPNQTGHTQYKNNLVTVIPFGL